MRAICMGQITYDMTVVTNEMPAPNVLSRYEQKVSCGGGKVANIACMLSKWGIQVSISGAIGNDTYGQKIKKEFEENNIDTRNLEISYDNDTEINMILVNKETKENTSFVISDNPTFLKKYDFDFTPDLVITDGFDINASKTLLAHYPKAVSMLYAADLNKNLLELCKKVNFVVCTKMFAEAATGLKIDYNIPETLMRVYEALKSKYEKTQIVITLDEHGALYCINNQIKVSPALKVDKIDNYGSGDIFRGAFIHTIMNGGDIEKAVKIGNIAAGLSIKTVGARLSIPKVEEVNKIYEQNY